MEAGKKKKKLEEGSLNKKQHLFIRVEDFVEGANARRPEKVEPASNTLQVLFSS